MTDPRADFLARAAAGGMVPFVREVLLDADTPVAAYATVAVGVVTLRARLFTDDVMSTKPGGTGLGTRIMQVVEEDLRQRGFEYVTLNVAKTNVDAQRLYYRHGYIVVAPESGIWNYPDQYGVWHRVEEPAWCMEKKLG